MIAWFEISGSLLYWINVIPWGWVMVIVLAFILLGWLIYKKAHIVVAETQVAVVYNTDTHGFSRFLSPGRHVLIPGLEYIRATISTEPRDTKGSCQARTQDEFPVTLNWLLTYRLELLNIDPGQCVDAVCTLINKAESRAILHTKDCIRELLGHYQLEDLWEIGIQNRIKRQLTRLVEDQLNPYGVAIERIIIDPPQIPAEFEAKRLAKLVRAIRRNKGDLSEAELEQIICLNSVKLTETERFAQVYRTEPETRSALRQRDRAPEIDDRDSLMYTAIHDIDIPNDGSIGKIVV